jgi:hypothetical protein
MKKSIPTMPDSPKRQTSLKRMFGVFASIFFSHFNRREYDFFYFHAENCPNQHGQ